MINEWFKQIQAVEEDSGEMENNIDAIIEILSDLDWDDVKYDIPYISCESYMFPALSLSREEIKEVENDLTAYYNGHISLGSIPCWIDGDTETPWRTTFALAAHIANSLGQLPEWDNNS